MAEINDLWDGMKWVAGAVRSQTKTYRNNIARGEGTERLYGQVEDVEARQAKGVNMYRIKLP